MQYCVVQSNLFLIADTFYYYGINEYTHSTQLQKLKKKQNDVVNTVENLMNSSKMLNFLRLVVENDQNQMIENE